MLRKIVFIFILLLISDLCFSQGYNHAWLIGYQNPKGRFNFTGSGYTYFNENRKIPFNDTHGNISDSNGNLLMSSNGIWIANATGDTMQNGSGLNPVGITNPNGDGLPLPYANLIIPYPEDSNKFILFHHTATFNGYSYPAYEIFYTVVDMALDSGLGGVDSNFKNVIAFQDTLNWGLAACRHANGRDWWVTVQKHDTDSIFKILVTNNGVQSVTVQDLNVPKAWYNVSQPTFSPDGTKFAYTFYTINFDSTDFQSKLALFDFDRCSGLFSNEQIILLDSTYYLWGMSFSPNSRFLYTSTVLNLYQFDTDVANVASSQITVAENDTFYSPSPPFLMTFDCEYLAADGKIYIVSGNSVLHVTYINYPDSAGLACDVQQHAIGLNAFNSRTVPNHPNYYLGCDTTSSCPCLATSLNEIEKQDFKFSLSPNPTNGEIKIMYLLPQNKSGTFQIFDVLGKKVFENKLPQWSTLQIFDVGFLGNGIYNCVITSNNFLVNKKLVVYK